MRLLDHPRTGLFALLAAFGLCLWGVSSLEKDAPVRYTVEKSEPIVEPLAAELPREFEVAEQSSNEKDTLFTVSFDTRVYTFALIGKGWVHEEQGLFTRPANADLSTSMRFNRAQIFVGTENVVYGSRWFEDSAGNSRGLEPFVSDNSWSPRAYFFAYDANSDGVTVGRLHQISMAFPSENGIVSFPNGVRRSLYALIESERDIAILSGERVEEDGTITASGYYHDEPDRLLRFTLKPHPVN